MNRITLVTFYLIFILLLAACGPETQTTPEATTPAATATAETEMEEMAEEEMTDEAMESNTIVDVAVNDGRFTTLVTAVTAADLAETLSGEGLFTVFAPTDDAFAALPEGMLETLLADPQGALTDVLLYHVVPGAVPAEAAVDLDSATTANGQNIEIAVVNGVVTLNDSAKVIITDVEADNGIIHVIDTVIMPPSMVSEALPTIAEAAAEAGNFNTLLAALEAAGLAETFAGEGDFTVFAPTDDAFAALPEGTVGALLADPEGPLTDILLYHAAAGAAPAETIVTLDSVTTLLGQDVTITVDDGRVFLNDTIEVVAADIMAANGIIHVIDGVLIPTAEATIDDKSATIVEAAVADGRFTTLVAAVEAAGLAETLSGEGSFTVFAPTDDAFAALPEGTIDTLLADPEGQLTDILLYHVVEGAVLAETVVTLESAITLLGQDVTITVDEEGNVFLNDTVQVIITDIETGNGIIHVIDGVLIPAN